VITGLSFSLDVIPLRSVITVVYGVSPIISVTWRICILCWCTFVRVMVVIGITVYNSCVLLTSRRLSGMVQFIEVIGLGLLTLFVGPWVDSIIRRLAWFLLTHDVKEMIN
jgi:hypothetical protein